MKLVFSWSLVPGTAENEEPKFKTTDAKLYNSVVTLSTQDNIKLLKQLEAGFKRTINRNKNLSKTTNQAQNEILDFFIDASFEGVNRLFVLSFNDQSVRESHRQYYLPIVEIKDCYIMIDGRNFFNSQ